MSNEEFNLRLQSLPDDKRIEVIERAAIIEFEGGLPREQANALAWRTEKRLTLPTNSVESPT